MSDMLDTPNAIRCTVLAVSAKLVDLATNLMLPVALLGHRRWKADIELNRFGLG
jgi:hypothetical protein